MFRYLKILPQSSNVILLAAAFLSLQLVMPPVAIADKAGAFVGGLIVGHVLNNMAERSERRTRAAEYQAYSSPPQSAPTPPQQEQGQSVQSRLDTLDQLAANGYISKEEYKKRRQAIIDGL